MRNKIDFEGEKNGEKLLDDIFKLQLYVRSTYLIFKGAAFSIKIIIVLVQKI